MKHGFSQPGLRPEPKKGKTTKQSNQVYSHGWLGNPTDKNCPANPVSNSRLASEGLPSHPWEYPLLSINRKGLIFRRRRFLRAARRFKLFVLRIDWRSKTIRVNPCLIRGSFPFYSGHSSHSWFRPALPRAPRCVYRRVSTSFSPLSRKRSRGNSPPAMDSL